MARRTVLVAAVAVLGALAVFIGAAGAGKSDSRDNRLTSYQEVPSLSTPGQGRFEARIRNNSTIDYVLTYSGLEGTVTQAHIHFAQPGVSGGISAWLCETQTNQSPSATTPACPPPSTRVTGTITANEVIGPSGQGIGPTQMNELIAAMRAGYTYANVHTSSWPLGEIRAQIKARGGGGGNDDDDDDD